jgi:hypothetical protein
LYQGTFVFAEKLYQFDRLNLLQNAFRVSRQFDTDSLSLPTLWKQWLETLIY